jgi:hypothetical protein
VESEHRFHVVKISVIWFLKTNSKKVSCGPLLIMFVFKLHKIAGSIPGIAASSGLEPLENLEGVSPPRQQEKDYEDK